VWLEGLGKLKNTITSSGIKSVTFRLVAMCFNYATMCMCIKDIGGKARRKETTRKTKT
jgi:hypothetical protein